MNLQFTTLFVTLLFIFQMLLGQPELLIVPEKALLDEEVSISLSGFSPHQRITIKAKSYDYANTLWFSWARFETNEQGELSLRKQAPLNGSYQNVDPMGLFWSLQAEEECVSGFKMNEAGYTIDFTVCDDTKVYASKSIERLSMAPLVKRISVNSEGIVGTLFIPETEVPLPIIVTLSGSNGGISESRAKLLASHGFATFALGFFGTSGLPKNLENIPLEYFISTCEYLSKFEEIDLSRLGIYGVSRGAELALLLASYFPEKVTSIVAALPSSFVFPCPGDKEASAWQFQGKPISYVSFPKDIKVGEEGTTPDTAISLTQQFLAAIKGTEAPERAAIPVEKIQASILLISGGDDQMWPSSFFAQQISDKVVCEHLYYPQAGHQINIPFLPAYGATYYHPLAEQWFTMGGSPQEDDFASRDSWKEILLFFRKTLKSS